MDIFKVTNDEDIHEPVDALFQYWKQKGFPNYDRNQYDVQMELSKLIKFDDSKIINGNDLKQTMHSCGYLWTYFPHWVNVKCGNDKSVIENWNDDEKLKTLIHKTYRWQQKHGNGVFTVNRLRQNAKVYCSKQSVSNFRPTAAKYIYNNYGNNGVVWDMCGGYGGRLFGFLASNCKHYIATEPCTLTYNGLCELRDVYSYVDKKVDIFHVGSEDFIPPKNTLDLCFTSPPYFDTEKYSEESTQSYIRFDTPKKWLEGYLEKTIQNCHYGLKDNGKLILNIANVQSLLTLELETIKIAERNGFDLIDTKYLILSSIAGKGVKREPIFIFKKV